MLYELYNIGKMKILNFMQISLFAIWKSRVHVAYEIDI